MHLSLYQRLYAFIHLFVCLYIYMCITLYMYFFHHVHVYLNLRRYTLSTSLHQSSLAVRTSRQEA